MSKITTEIVDRAHTYGLFKDNAAVSQALKRLIATELAKRNVAWDDDQWEAMEMICTKIARLVNGDRNHVDSWEDIAGFAKLVADRLNGNAR